MYCYLKLTQWNTKVYQTSWLCVVTHSINLDAPASDISLIQTHMDRKAQLKIQLDPRDISADRPSGTRLGLTKGPANQRGLTQTISLQRLKFAAEVGIWSDIRGLSKRPG